MLSLGILLARALARSTQGPPGPVHQRPGGAACDEEDLGELASPRAGPGASPLREWDYTSGSGRTSTVRNECGAHGKIARVAPVAQRIERCPPEAETGVQFAAGAPPRAAPHVRGRSVFGA